MKGVIRLFRWRIVDGEIDGFLLRLAQITCFALAGFVFMAGMQKLDKFGLEEAQVFSAIQQVAQTALLLCIMGLLLQPKANNVS